MNYFGAPKFRRLDVILLTEVPIGGKFRTNRNNFVRINEKEAIALKTVNNLDVDFLDIEENQYLAVAVSKDQLSSLDLEENQYEE
jgi:hypothetical protein